MNDHGLITKFPPIVYPLYHSYTFSISVSELTKPSISAFENPKLAENSMSTTEYTPILFSPDKIPAPRTSTIPIKQAFSNAELPFKAFE